MFYFTAAEITHNKIFSCMLQWPCKSLQDFCSIYFILLYFMADDCTCATDAAIYFIAQMHMKQQL